ncbi:ATP-binding protein [Clostridium sp.]|uniref:ATP-binding protein n=1 Tax=Clostridium sp. TaxID=1506 RepID=UPI0028FFD5AC|nr:ATP-binding protein [Clostridium sp.]MDU2106216.1 ATP-binding protein [Clostridium sp.]MDU3355255.1 ATP-binding protein [Clostridium sp.]
MKEMKEKTINPISKEEIKVTTKKNEEDLQELIRPGRLYESLRFAEYSLNSGIGEILDNSIEAGSSKIWINIENEDKQYVKNGKKRKAEVIKEIVIVDDGEGMNASTLKKSLVLGESCRTIRSDGRKGIGRFGVGLTLGGISLARRIEVYSRRNAKEPFLYTYIDLDEIYNEELVNIPNPIEKKPPEEHNMKIEDSSGTIIILSKCDRLQNDSVNGGSLKASDHIKGLSTFIGRTYRKFIAGGVEIFFNKEKVYLHDPLYIMGPTIFDTKDNVDPKAELKGEETIELEIPNSGGKTAEVRIKMSLLPAEWRKHQGDGGSVEAKKRKINENEGISILRAEREVLYDKVEYIIGVRGLSKFDFKDRFWGCEISFPPELDDYFHVRYIKRGAEPIASLKDKIREIIAPVVKNLRAEISQKWSKTKAEEAMKSGKFGNAEDVMSEVSKILPNGKKGLNLSEHEEEEKIDEIMKSVILEGVSDSEVAISRRKKREELKEKPYKIEPVSFPQNIFFETEHILGRVIIKLNINHPFYKKIFVPLCGSIELDDENNDIYLNNYMPKIKDAIMLLLLSYAKAESMFADQDDLFMNMRSQWGTILSTAINKLEE